MWWLWLACSSTPEPAPAPTPKLGAHHPSENKSKPPVGRWNKARQLASPDEIAALEAIGYVGGENEGRGLVGVTLNTPEAQPGVNLYVSGDAPEAVLMDLEGNVLHTWKKTFAESFPGRKVKNDARGPDFWRRAALLPNGDLLAIYEGQGLIRVDRDSNLKWAWDGLAHHDLQVLPDGTIHTLSRKAHIVEAIHPTKPVLEDFVAVLSAEGELLREFSVLEAVRQSPARTLLKRMPKKHGDIFHTNSIEVLEGQAENANPAFKRGNLLLSSRALSAIFIVDSDSESVVWHHTGIYSKQHDPKVVDPGVLLLFDNMGPRGQNSAVREFDIATMKQTWSYTGSERAPFFTRFTGAAERLPNGNTLISESGYGHVFEVNPAGKRVWEFYNPRRTGEHNEFVAIIPELVRLDPATLPFLKGSAPPAP